MAIKKDTEKLKNIKKDVDIEGAHHKEVGLDLQEENLIKVKDIVEIVEIDIKEIIKDIKNKEVEAGIDPVNKMLEKIEIDQEIDLKKQNMTQETKNIIIITKIITIKDRIKKQILIIIKIDQILNEIEEKIMLNHLVKIKNQLNFQSA